MSSCVFKDNKSYNKMKKMLEVRIDRTQMIFQ